MNFAPIRTLNLYLYQYLYLYLYLYLVSNGKGGAGNSGLAETTKGAGSGWIGANPQANCANDSIRRQTVSLVNQLLLLPGRGRLFVDQGSQSPRLPKAGGINLAIISELE